MITFFLELFFTFLPKLVFVLNFTAGSIFFFLYLPSLLFDNELVPTWIYNTAAYDVFTWLYYAVIFSAGGLFLIQTVRRSKGWFTQTKTRVQQVPVKQWLALGTLLFIFFFPALLFLTNSDAYNSGATTYGIGLVMIFFFFLMGGHAAVMVYLLFAVKNLLVQVGKQYKSLGKIGQAVPRWLSTSVRTILLIYPIFAGLSGMALFFTEVMDNPQASRFFIVNAAIKNTCFMDPDRENCPTRAEEIAYIEPAQYKMLEDCCQVNYQYHPETNLYSLVVRYTPTKAVVFDWRFTHETSIDFKEYDVSLFGRDHLVNPPEWDGPWYFEDWEYL